MQQRKSSAISSQFRTPIGSVIVVIPTFNERDNLERIVSSIRTVMPAADILVVDDNSPDGTGEIAEKLSRSDAHVYVLHRERKAGIGTAYVSGFGWALERGYDALVQMDADGSHDPAEIPRLLQALQSSDLAIGSRWLPGSSVLAWPISREILSKAANAYTRLMLGFDVRDATSGYKAYRADSLHLIGLERVASQGYCFQIDLTFRAAQAGLTVTEVPITFVNRTRGQSKMSRSIVIEALMRVAEWSIAARLGYDSRHRQRPSPMRASS
jgi:dolichol-phosphate mannosyltransferase